MKRGILASSLQLVLFSEGANLLGMATQQSSHMMGGPCESVGDAAAPSSPMMCGPCGSVGGAAALMGAGIGESPTSPNLTGLCCNCGKTFPVLQLTKWSSGLKSCVGDKNLYNRFIEQHGHDPVVKAHVRKLFGADRYAWFEKVQAENAGKPPYMKKTFESVMMSNYQGDRMVDGRYRQVFPPTRWHVDGCVLWF